MKNEIVIFDNQNIKLEVNMKDETVWLNQMQMAELFDKDRTVITRHINNIFKEGELDKKTNVQKLHIPNSDKPVTFYNLDVIISVGYRVKSKNGVAFRKWANKVLKDYLIKGYAVNEKRLKALEKTIELIDIANRLDNRLESIDAKSVLKVITSYTKALDLLDDYDHKTLKIKGTNKSLKKIDYEECMNVINTLKFNESSDIFALERDNGFKTIIDTIYQTFDGEELYKTTEEKAANFLYLTVKNHAFIDGNKRIAATMFIYFLNYYNMLYKDNNLVIDNNTLTALTLLIAESNPKEKDLITALIMNFLA